MTGGWAKAGKHPRAPTRAPHIRRFFPCGGDFRGFGWPSRTMGRGRKRSKSKVCGMTRDRTAGISPIFEPFSLGAGEAAQPELPGMPAPTRTCLRCGGAVPAPKRAGRPARFCSAACRRDQAVEQRAAWCAANAPAEDRRAEVRCWSCGTPFAAEAKTAGRLPRYCGASCRRAARLARKARYRARKRRGGGRVESLEPPGS